MLHKKQESFPAKIQNALGFTLVELIVVVTILAILATIGFVSYSSYLTGVRDTNRLSQLVSISDGLELYRTKKDLPLPDDNVEVQVNGTNIAYQGYAGSNTLETIDFTKGGKDPKDDSYFTYYLTEDRKYFQLLGFLEEEENITSYNNASDYSPSLNGMALGQGELSFGIIPEAQAADYSNRIPTVYGKKLGVLTDINNTPIQDTISSGSLNITSGTTGYVGYMTDTQTLSGASLQSINPVASCKRIKQLSGGSSDGTYEINPTGVVDAEIEVYCDMTTDGGGWTLLGRSVAASTGSMGWGVSAGSITNNNSHYSLGVVSESLIFTKIMVARYSTEKNIDYAVAFDVDFEDLDTLSASQFPTSNCQLVGKSGLDPTEISWDHCFMFQHWGSANVTTNFYFNDIVNFSTRGLGASGIDTYQYSSTYGAWHETQGMIFIR